MSARSHTIRITAMAVLVVAAALASCEQAPPGSLLVPTGGGEEGGGSYVSPYSAMQVVGDFNGFDAGVASMSFIDGLWVDTLTVQAGCYLMKFRTNDDWDETPDFGRCSGSEDSCQVPVPTDGLVVAEAICLVTGSGTAIGQVEFFETGSYLFEVDEPAEEYRISRLVAGSLSGQVSFEGSPSPLPVATITVFETGTSNEVTTGTSDPATGAFLIEGLTPGTYDLRAQASGYTETSVSGVQVAAFQNTNVGTLNLQLGCSYLYTDMQVVGDFNGFDQNAPSMSQIGSCVWADTLDITAGCYYMKFRTDGDWDPTPDFGRCSGSEGTCQSTVPLDGSALVDSTCAVTGTGTALGQIEFLADGMYEFLLDEGASEFRIRSLSQVPTGSISGSVAFSDAPGTSPAVTVRVFAAGTTNQVATTTSDPVTDTFSVASLLAGTYDLQLTATGYLTQTVAGVTVSPPGDTAVGTVTMQKGGAIVGTVSFSDSPPTNPTVSLTVFTAGTTTQVATGTSNPADNTFAVTNLATGSYDVRFTASNYATRDVTGVAVTAPNDTDLGVIALTKTCTSSYSNVDVQFLGPGFPAQTAMTEVQPCVWRVTVALPVGCSEMQFPADFFAGTYKRCSGIVATCAFPIPTDGSAYSQTVCDDPTRDFIGEIQITQAGNYEIELDEGSAPAQQAVMRIRMVP